MESFFCIQHQLCGGYPNSRGYSNAYNVNDVLLSFQSSALSTRSGHNIEVAEVLQKKCKRLPKCLDVRLKIFIGL